MSDSFFPDTPSLNFLLGANFYPYFEDHFLDAGESLDRGILFALEEHRLTANERDLTEILDRSPDEASAKENLMPWLSMTGVPDGTGYRDFLVTTLERVRQALDDPSSIPDPGDEREDLRPPRVSRFVDLETGNTASTIVLRVHEPQLRAWADEPGGWWRQHFYVPDAGMTTGYVIHQDDREHRHDVRGAVVVMKRDHETGQPFVLTAYPEIELPTAQRAELPDLPHVLGGYLGQDCFDEGGPLVCQHNFQATTGEPARSQVRTQLDSLLTQNDDDLREAVEALGCYVLPRHVRAYMMRMRWRLDAFDWSQTAEP